MSPAMFFSHGTPIDMKWDFPRHISHNTLLTIGSDWGAAPDPSLFPAMAGIVDVVGDGDRAKGGELLCKMLTINGALATGREKDVGSIEVGKKANFVVVDRNLAKGEFGGARVVRTYFEGECVWDGEE